MPKIHHSESTEEYLSKYYIPVEEHFITTEDVMVMYGM